jgi:hypothetical protein
MIKLGGDILSCLQCFLHLLGKPIDAHPSR